MAIKANLESNRFGAILVAMLLIFPAAAALTLPAPQNYEVQIYPGWNMISVSADLPVKELAFICGASQYAWRLSQSGYIKEAVLKPGEGYWIKGTRECRYAYSASPIFANKELFSGWNLVGAPPHKAEITDYAGDCKIISGPWHYYASGPAQSPYRYSSTLEPGKAYWIKAASSCRLGFGKDEPPSPPQPNLPPVITKISGPSQLAVGQQGTWTISAYDPEGRQLTYYVTWGDEFNKQGSSASTPASQTASFTHTYNSAGTYKIVVKVVDDAGESETASISVTVFLAPVPEPPQQRIIIPQSGEYEINVAWYDTSGSSVIAVEKPNFKNLGTFTGANNWVNRVTPIGYLKEGEEVVLSIQTQWNGRWYEKAFSTNPHYFSITQKGNKFTIEADDGIKFDGGYNDALIYLQPSRPNPPPVITSVSGPSQLTVGQQGTWTISAYDPEGRQLTYYVTWGDEPAELARRSAAAEQSSTISHTYNSAGTYTITFTVVDEQGASASSTYRVQVYRNAPSYSIKVSSPIGGEEFVAGQTYMIAWSVSSDLNGRLSCVQAINVNTGAATNIDCGNNPLSAGQAAWNIPSNFPEGQYKIRVGIHMHSREPFSESGVITVKRQIQQNLPPVITSVSGPSQLAVGQQGTWTISAYDPEGRQLTYSFIWGDENPRMPKPMAVVQTASATHSYSAPGAYTVYMTVYDEQGASAQAALTVQVYPASCQTTATCLPGLVPVFSHIDKNGCQVFVCVPQAQQTSKKAAVQ
ncbi:MAG: PKD domain-containing protein [Candidatus Micrarchaeota archaeon]|nr:PKD domain-containing protein [Candidatus Micrarchaeota archaeon]